MMSLLGMVVKSKKDMRLCLSSNVTLELTQCCHLAQCAGFIEVVCKGQEAFYTSQASCIFINSIININTERQMKGEAEKETSERLGT